MTTLSMFRDSREAVAFEAGQVIFTEGEAGRHLYVVVEGEVEITSRGRLIRTLGPGGLFGEMALIEQGPRSATATAKGAVRAVPVDERRFHFLIQQTPFFALQVMRIMSERLREQQAA